MYVYQVLQLYSMEARTEYDVDTISLGTYTTVDKAVERVKQGINELLFRNSLVVKGPFADEIFALSDSISEDIIDYKCEKILKDDSYKTNSFIRGLGSIMIYGYSDDDLDEDDWTEFKVFKIELDKDTHRILEY